MSVRHESILQLDRSLQSILNQDYSELILIVVQDSYDKRIYNYLNKLKSNTDNVYLINNRKNYGLAYSLNQAISYTADDIKYIARMDADDYSYPDRLSAQVRFMENNPHIDVCGTSAKIYSCNGSFKYIYIPPTTHIEIEKSIYSKSPFVHPTVIAKRSFFLRSNGYNINLKRAQDWELWHRMINNSKYANIEKIGIKYYEANGLTILGSIHAYFVALSIAVKSPKKISNIAKASFSFIIKILFSIKQLIK